MAEGMKYIQAGEVMIPDLTTVQEQIDIGKYGSMRRRFLQEHRRGTYSAMILQGTLNRYLREVNEQTKSRIEELTKEAAKEYKEEVDEVKEKVKEAVDDAAEEIKKEVEE